MLISDLVTQQVWVLLYIILITLMENAINLFCLKVEHLNLMAIHIAPISISDIILIQVYMSLCNHYIVHKSFNSSHYNILYNNRFISLTRFFIFEYDCILIARMELMKTKFLTRKYIVCIGNYPTSRYFCITDTRR